MDNTDVLICVTKFREEEKRICNYLEEFGMIVDVRLDSMELPLEKHSFDSVGIGLIRCLSQKEALIRASFLELSGIKTLNSLRAISICTNKINQSIIFQKFNIPQPRFKVAFNPNNFEKVFETFGDEFIIKPASSSWGRGIAKITGATNLDAWFAARESVDPSNQSYPVLIQEFIDKGNYDIRVVIVGKEPIVAFRRISNDNWKTNTHLGAEIDPIPLNEEMAFICKQLVKVLGEGIYGVDLFYDYKRKTYLVCEVNQNPEFSKSWKVHGVDVACHIANYIKKEIIAKQKYHYQK
jgi:lysine biosynthesis enzyme LysX